MTVWRGWFSILRILVASVMTWYNSTPKSQVFLWEVLEFDTREGSSPSTPLKYSLTRGLFSHNTQESSVVVEAVRPEFNHTEVVDVLLLHMLTHGLFSNSDSRHFTL